MKLSAAAVFTFVLVFAGVAGAQQPRPPVPQIDRGLSSPPVTPELWIYSQEMQRHDDPAQAVRRKAEIKADQRLSRLAALKWYGHSNTRPETSPIPTMGTYSPSWVGNGWNRYDWAALGGPSLTLRYDVFELRR
jgi:hypothetical protein